MLGTHWSRSWPLGLVLVLGCSAFTDRAHHDGDSPADAGRVDAGRTDGGQAGGGAPEPLPTVITVENTGSSPLVLGNQCGGRFVGLSYEGEELTYDRSCSCECGGGACGCPAICFFTQELVVPGEQSSFEWDGLFANFEDHPSCYELSSIPIGDTVTASACWNEDAAGTPLDCASQDFTYGVEREITISAKHDSAARTPVRIRFQNRTGGPIDIVTDSSCQQDWFQLALPLPEGRSATLGKSCACSCDADFEPGTCPECGTCPLPTSETVPAGEIRSFDWDGMFWYGYPSGCKAQYAMPAGFLVKAQICFTRQSTGVRTCQPVSFTLGESDEFLTTVL